MATVSIQGNDAELLEAVEIGPNDPVPFGRMWYRSVKWGVRFPDPKDALPERNKQTFLHVLGKVVRRDGVGDLMSWLDGTDFFEAPASAKYHGSVEGGLCAHSLSVYLCALDVMDMLDATGRIPANCTITDESVAIAALLHDLCKIDSYRRGTRNVKDPETGHWHPEPCYFYNNDRLCLGHGSESAIRALRYMQLSDDESAAILFHMGSFNKSQQDAMDVSKAYGRSLLAWVTHVADEMSTFVCDI